MDLKLVKKLLDLISESDANEIAVEEGDFKMKVKKVSSDAQPVQYQMAAPQQQAPAPQPAKPQAESAGSSPAESKPDGETVKSPIVGTYYEAPSPDSDPFISVGDSIKKGQTLCIVEAMKIMNEIEAEFDGVVQKILVNNGQPVEFDQPLFIIKKA